MPWVPGADLERRYEQLLPILPSSAIGGIQALKCADHTLDRVIPRPMCEGRSSTLLAEARSLVRLISQPREAARELPNVTRIHQQRVDTVGQLRGNGAYSRRHYRNAAREVLRELEGRVVKVDSGFGEDHG